MLFPIHGMYQLLEISVIAYFIIIAFMSLNAAKAASLMKILLPIYDLFLTD